MNAEKREHPWFVAITLALGAVGLGVGWLLGYYLLGGR